MTPVQYLRAFARGWWIIVLCVVAGTALTLLLDQLATSTYTSTSNVLVSPVRTAHTTSSDAYSAALLAQQRMASYVEIAGGDTVAQDVLERLDLHLSVDQLEDRIAVSVRTGTTLLTISVRDPHADETRQIAAHAAESVATVIDRIEATRGEGRPVLRAAVVSQERPAVSATAAPAWRNPVVGAVASLLVGLGLAVAVARLDPRLRDEDQVVDALGAPVLGVLPGPAEQHDEAVRELRTSLFFQLPGADRCLSVAVSSPHAVEGVPQLSSAVASALADTGARVLLVEGDLLDPRLAALLELNAAGAGLTDYLDGGATIDDVTRKHAASGVDVIVAGTTPTNPADLLHSPALGQLVEDAAHRYDFVLVTAPPTTVGTDAAALAARCDGVLLTVVRGRTTEPEVVAARTQFERVHTPVLGAVLVS
ncbi:polysaccharide biosynthesis tyrosine autokinase [Marmoricola sp. URHB0036]|uniref:polysaccharide biosynthesis tyrosine autokinase n=1 Tax=Marmoricola sp. URHB0036 TaxID=1298863 RepID=UPI0003F7BA31|nr:polysaccharide biosynthesis tyrosine autokinase [Marmoricola sp. URHB0036]